MCSQRVSPITPAMAVPPGPAAALLLRLLSELMCQCREWSCGPSTRNSLEMVGSGQVRESWAISFRLTVGQNRCGVKPARRTCMKAPIKAPAQHPHVRHKQAFNNLPWGWEDGTEAIYSILLKEAVSVLWLAPCSPSTPHTHKHTHPQTHTMTSLLEWKNAPRGAAHPRMQLCLCLEPWWITVGNLKSLQRSDLYQKWGQLEYAPFNVSCMYSWIPHHLVSATPSCQGREPLSPLKPKGGEHILWLGCRYFKGNMGNN